MRVVLVMSFVVLVSCYRHQSSELAGVWIEKDIQDRNGSFKTIYFYNDSSFARIYSTQMIDQFDSIHFRAEPGFIVESGVYKYSSKSRYQNKYQLIYRTFRREGEEIPGKFVRSFFDIISMDNQKLIVFENDTLLETQMYTQESQRQLLDLANKFIPAVRKAND